MVNKPNNLGLIKKLRRWILMKCTAIFGSKKNYIRIAVDRYGKRFGNFISALRGRAAFKRFWAKMEEKSISQIMTGFYEGYFGGYPCR